MTKTKLFPQEGDELLFGKYLTGYNRRNQPVMSDGREKATDVISGVYEDGDVRSSTGEKFSVELRSPRRKFKTKTGVVHKPALWVTVA